MNRKKITRLQQCRAILMKGVVRLNCLWFTCMQGFYFLHSLCSGGALQDIKSTERNRPSYLELRNFIQQQIWKALHHILLSCRVWASAPRTEHRQLLESTRNSQQLKGSNSYSVGIIIDTAADSVSCMSRTHRRTQANTHSLTLTHARRHRNLLKQILTSFRFLWWWGLTWELGADHFESMGHLWNHFSHLLWRSDLALMELLQFMFMLWE